MFDRYVGARTQKVSRSRTWLFGVSALAHAGGLTALLLWSFWQVEKVVGKYVPVHFVELKTPAPPPPPAAPQAPQEVKPRKAPRVSHEAAQPVPVPDVVVKPDTGRASDPTAADTGSSTDPDGTPGGTGDADGKCLTPPCAPAVPAVDEKPVTVPMTAVEAQRISGTREIQLPGEVKQQMAAQGRDRVTATVKLCVSADGVPSRIDVVGSTGFPSADAKLRSEIGNWRYRPYSVNGRATAICTAVTFQYRLE